MLHHHPLLLAGAAWWALLSVTVRLDTSALIVGLLPTLTVIVQFLLSRRQARKIAEESKVKVQEVHTLVNSQRVALEAQLAEQRVQIQALNDRLAALPPPAAVA